MGGESGTEVKSSKGPVLRKSGGLPGFYTLHCQDMWLTWVAFLDHTTHHVAIPVLSPSLSFSLPVHYMYTHTTHSVHSPTCTHTLPTCVPHMFALYKHTSYPHLTRWEAFRASVSVSHSWAKEEVRPPPTHATGRGLGSGQGRSGLHLCCRSSRSRRWNLGHWEGSFKTQVSRAPCACCCVRMHQGSP